MQYNPDFLNPRDIFTPQEQAHLATLSQNLPLGILLQSPRNMEEIGIDFVHSSAQLEGNTYDKHDTLALLKMGQTAGGKLFSDAVMLLNLRASYQYMLSCLDFRQPVNWKDFIKTTHSLIAKDLLPNNELGTVRQGSVQISGTDYTPLVSPQKLDAELIKKNRLIRKLSGLNWCRRQESNSRPPDYKSGALPTELHRLGKTALCL